MTAHSSKDPSPLYALAVANLIALAAVVFHGKAYENLLRGIDSNMHASIGMMVTRGNSLLPRLPMMDPHFDAPTPAKIHGAIHPHVFNDHPFFMFWVNGWVQRLLGPSAWSARLTTSIFSVGCVLLTLWLGAILHSPIFGFISALTLVLTKDFITTGATASLDPPMLFFILLSFILWRKKKWVGLGIAAGVGLWIKTPVVLLVYPCATIGLWLERKSGDGKNHFLKLAGAFAISLLVGSVVWWVTALIGDKDLVIDYWSRQVWGTSVEGRSFNFAPDWFMFFRLVRTGFLPGLPLLVAAIFVVFRRREWRLPSVWVPIAAISITAGLITLLKFKMGHYFIPTFPFLAILSTHALLNWANRNEEKIYRVFCSITPLALAFVSTTPLVLGPEAFVAMKRFFPIIQRHGQCSDMVYYVRGGQPIGSVDIDYKYLTHFYTGHPTQALDCQELMDRGPSVEKSWLILSKENYQNCLTPEQKSSFPTRFQAENQVLLTRIIEAHEITDLSPLDVELQAVTDCAAPPYPEDIYHRY